VILWVSAITGDVLTSNCAMKASSLLFFYERPHKGEWVIRILLFLRKMIHWIIGFFVGDSWWVTGEEILTVIIYSVITDRNSGEEYISLYQLSVKLNHSLLLTNLKSRFDPPPYVDFETLSHWFLFWPVWIYSSCWESFLFTGYILKHYENLMFTHSYESMI
jgi:hypothetical protein